MLSLQGKYRKNETYFCNIQTDLKRGKKNEGRHTKKKGGNEKWSKNKAWNKIR